MTYDIRETVFYLTKNTDFLSAGLGLQTPAFNDEYVMKYFATPLREGNRLAGFTASVTPLDSDATYGLGLHVDRNNASGGSNGLVIGTYKYVRCNEDDMVKFKRVYFGGRVPNICSTTSEKKLKMERLHRDLCCLVQDLPPHRKNYDVSTLLVLEPHKSVKRWSMFRSEDAWVTGVHVNRMAFL